MIKILTTETFENLFLKLPRQIQLKTSKAIRLLAENPRHPSLRCKPIQGAPGDYEASIDMHYRLSYERLPVDRLLLRVVGKHDEVLKKP
jgi:mRNA interferase RelE/StbE